jgi:hypothetical protein
MKLASVLVLIPAIAYADGARTDFDEPSVPEHVGRPSSPLEPGVAMVQKLAGGEQGFVIGTALTVPQGQVEVATRTLFPYAGMVSIAGGLTSTTEIWADAGSSIAGGTDGVRSYAAGIKQVIAKSRNFQLAAVGSVRSLRLDGLFDDEDVSDGGGSTADYSHLAMAGLAATLVSDTGGVIVTFGVQGARSIDHSTSDTALVEMAGLSLGEGNTRVLAEAVHVDGGVLGFLGVRLGSDATALDVGAILANGVGLVPAPLVSLRTRL